LHALTEASRGEAPQPELGNAGVAAVSGDEAWFFYQFADLHELAHNIVFSTLGATITPLNEGAAQATGSAVAVEYPVCPPVDPVADLLVRDFPEFDYRSYLHSGFFVRYVLDTRGPDVYRELHQSVSRLESATEIRTQFEAVMGDTVEAIDADFASEKRCVYQMPFCGDWLVPELPVFVDGLDCESQDVLGYVGPDAERFVPYRAVAFELPEPSRLFISASAASWGIRPCGECSEQYSSGYITTEEGEVVANAPLYEWRAGRYYAIVRALDPEVPVQFSIEIP
ncbi:MAG: hypothetical protein JKY37_27775, partial [Nannocystaceae bacterium]|nr:hypothetical protein [Nannocystaceae bacterium]